MQSTHIYRCMYMVFSYYKDLYKIVFIIKGNDLLLSVSFLFLWSIDYFYVITWASIVISWFMFVITWTMFVITWTMFDWTMFMSTWTMFVNTWTIHICNYQYKLISTCLLQNLKSQKKICIYYHNYIRSMVKLYKYINSCRNCSSVYNLSSNNKSKLITLELIKLALC